VSSGILGRSTHPELFRWSPDLDPARYLFATYHISCACDVEAAAAGMAMEQSAATVSIKGFVSPDSMGGWTIRVRSIRKAQGSAGVQVRPYSLSTEVYPRQEQDQDSPECWEVELAFPLSLFAGRPSQILNSLVGELPRLGFITSFRLIEAALPAVFGPGPAFGVQGIRDKLGNPRGPLLCRSMRPAVGLDLETMARLNQEVLVGGFHLVKDDELAYFSDDAAFKEHLQAMVRARDEARERAGEPKLYLANLICEPEELETRWDLACELGVDAVLVAPFIQGPGILPRLARQARMPILAHNTFSDLLTRHPGWGLEEAVLCGWLRRLGADWFVTPGPFATPDYPSPLAQQLLLAASAPLEGMRPSMPILQGGKHPEGLAGYRAAFGSTEFMLIVANWVDSHPEGLAAAARRFREQVDG
jgi:ribulose 1,5-bisphosphate carboxylase large subunit-like protein